MSKCTHLGEDELVIIRIAAEEINTLVIEHVSSNDSVVHIDREANIRRDNLHGEDVYRVTRKERSAPTSTSEDSIFLKISAEFFPKHGTKRSEVGKATKEEGSIFAATILAGLHIADSRLSRSGKPVFTITEGGLLQSLDVIQRINCCVSVSHWTKWCCSETKEKFDSYACARQATPFRLNGTGRNTVQITCGR
jgi:hypothetical protein